MKYPFFKKQDNRLILYKGLVYILNQPRDMILKLYYKESLYRHQGIEKTLKHILRTFYFPRINKAVK
jgi:Integrase zinc binding domain